ncbi:Uncharacterised protein [Yersinia aldovae]|uniref:hypothetical protein n=1 Tax=Yersinia aldovae TaxID=29483 RepID=UPI0005E5EC6A|nr:hypothetical protein [Yersinia aldovae]CNJ03991.1 Uncharacterised protein [Yersinia aldovae]
MTLKCKHCQSETSYLVLGQANIVEAPEGGWTIDLILKCPTCNQAYKTFIPTGYLKPQGRPE